jgi:hypothetical protein
MPESSQEKLIAWFNDFELSVGKSIVRASVEKKRSWGGGALGVTPRSCEGGRGGERGPKVEKKIPQVTLIRQIPSLSCYPRTGVNGVERRVGAVS